MTTLYSRLNEQVKKDFMGFTALAIILSTCLGSIAIMFTLMNGNGLVQMAQVFFVVVVCSAHNASILTVQKPKVVFNLLILSVVVNSLLIMSNSLF